MDDTPRFDEVFQIELREHQGELVVHRDPNGEIFAWHSPLGSGTIHCSICESGARVYLA